MKKEFVYILITFTLFACDKKQEHKNHSDHQTIDGLHLSDLQVQLGHILTDSISEHELGDELILSGVVSVNQNKISSISSRVMGRIEKLYFKNSGDEIKLGEPIYEIYSDELNLAAKELLQASEKKKSFTNLDIDFEKILQSAKNKLLLYGLTSEQIIEIEQKKIFQNTFIILSTVSGVISSVDTKEGASLMEGESIFHLADLSSLWVEAQIYADDLNKIKENITAKIYLPNNETKTWEGKISFVNPELNFLTRINTIRIEIGNENHELKPGLQVSVNILLNKKKALAVPTDAVIMEEKGATVWIKTAHNQFKSIMVQTGIESSGFTEIIHGLKRGDVIVTSGAYLLNSEFTIRNGTNPMEEHNH